MTKQEFMRLLQQLTAKYQGLAALHERLGLSETARALRQEAASLDSGVFKVMVIGDFNSGKSTLLNALLGAECLSSKATPATAVITVVEYGEQPEMTVHFHGNRQPERLSVSAFQEKYQLKTEAEEATNELTALFSNVRQAVLRYPLDLCRHKVVLIDSPGLNESIESSQITDEYLTEADLILFVFNAIRACSENEERYLAERIHPLAAGRVVFAVNMWDLVDKTALYDLAGEKRELLARFEEKLTKFLTVPFAESVFPVSAKQALAACGAGEVDEKAWQLSGMAALQQCLEERLFTYKGQAVLRQGVELAQRLAAWRVRQVLSTIKAVECLDDAAWRQQVRLVQQQLPLLARLRDQVRGVVPAQLALTQDKMKDAVQEFMQGLAEEYRQYQWCNAMDDTNQGISSKTAAKMAESMAIDYMERRLGSFCRSTLRQILAGCLADTAKQMKSTEQAFEQTAANIFTGLANGMAVPPVAGGLLTGLGKGSGLQAPGQKTADKLAQRLTARLALPMLTGLRLALSMEAALAGNNWEQLMATISQTIANHLPLMGKSLLPAIEEEVAREYQRNADKAAQNYNLQFQEFCGLMEVFSRFRQYLQTNPLDAGKRLSVLEDELNHMAEVLADMANSLDK